jgi:hypothetical protein
MMFNATFKKISFILWRLNLLGAGVVIELARVVVVPEVLDS